MPDGAAPADGYRRGEPGYRHRSIALFCSGVATFAALYAIQPLLPLLAAQWHVTPGAATLSLAVTTAALALSLLPAGWLSDRIGRVPTMRASLCTSALLGVLCAFAPSFGALLVLRGLEGIALAGVPAVGMAYLTEEIHPSWLGGSIGLYIGGNGVGGMAGRVVAGVLADLGGWRLAVAGVGAISVVCALIFWRFAPTERTAPQASATLRVALARIAIHLREPGQRRLEAVAALLMGMHVAVYNGLGFRLAGAPYNLGAAAISLVYLVFGLGAVSSAFAGRLADRYGRRRVLPCAVLVALSGVAITLGSPLPVVIAGTGVVTMGFFAAHSVAASWVGRRARTARAQAAALYLCAYYAGSSIGGPLAGFAWSRDRWDGVAILATLLLLAALAVSLRLWITPPVAQAPGPDRGDGLRSA